MVDPAQRCPETPFEILLVEDNPDDVRLIEAAAKTTDFETVVRVTASGDATLDLLAKRAEETSVSVPDPVLLDLNLPDGDGEYASLTERIERFWFEQERFHRSHSGFARAGPDPVFEGIRTIARTRRGIHIAHGTNCRVAAVQGKGLWPAEIGDGCPNSDRRVV